MILGSWTRWKWATWGNLRRLHSSPTLQKGRRTYCRLYWVSRLRCSQISAQRPSQRVFISCHINVLFPVCLFHISIFHPSFHIFFLNKSDLDAFRLQKQLVKNIIEPWLVQYILLYISINSFPYRDLTIVTVNILAI